MTTETTGSEQSSGEGQETSQASVDWKSGLDAAYLDNESIKNAPDINTLAKGYVSLERMIGNSIRIPGEDAGEQDVSAFHEKLMSVPGVVKLPSEGNEVELNDFYAKMGRPESFDKYEVTRPEDIPDGIEYSEQMENWFKEQAFAQGLNNKQVQGIMSAWNEMTMQEGQQRLAERDESANYLKNKWGADYERRNGVVQTLLNKFGNDGAYQELIESGLGNNPRLIEMLSNVGMATLEDSMINSQHVSTEPTPEELNMQINEIMSNPAYMDSKHINHKSLVEKVHALQQKLTNYEKTDIFEGISI